MTTIKTLIKVSKPPFFKTKISLHHEIQNR
jgi:hypothetical protein